MEKTIALIPGDGIGPDVVAEAVKVLDAVAKKYGHKWNYTHVLAGGCAIDKFGHPLPKEQLQICLDSDAALLGAVGGPKWDNLPSEIRPEIERIVRMGFEYAMNRQKRLCVVDKANILNSSQLWRRVAEDVKKDYPEVALSYLYIDNASMQMVRNPKQFDVIATSNMFGDILSDEASQITGSIGMLASASLGDGTGPGLYEPIHGSAPDIAGKNLANPLATILSAAMLLRYSFKLETEAKAIEDAVQAVLDEGWRTGDIAGSHLAEVKAAGKLLGTKEMGQKVADKI